ncbi:MAG: Type pilus assembly protein PilM, partial [Verrucomicrobiota bacterium]
MALPFLNRSTRREQVVVIDLGGRTTKAVVMARRGAGFALLKYAIADAPAPQKTFSSDVIGEHLKSIVETLGVKTKGVSMAVGVNDVIVRQAELPQLPLQDMRLVLKTSPKTYLQQDLPNHLFDCFILPLKGGALAGAAEEKDKDKDKDKAKPPMSQKLKVLVTGAKKQFVDDMAAAATSATLKAEGIIPGLIGPLNSLEAAKPDVFGKGIVAVVDIGFKTTTICILQEGELVLTRVVGVG